MGKHSGYIPIPSVYKENLIVMKVTESEEDEFTMIPTGLLEGSVEFNKSTVSNIRRIAAMQMAIINEHTKIMYHKVTRTKHEVRGGYKIALRKGAKLNEVEVSNLMFRFKNPNGELVADGLALMFRHPKTGEEHILLLPVNTNEVILKERIIFLDEAIALVFNFASNKENSMDPDEQDFLLRNLELVSLHERCAQSLINEYGHILNYRLFDKSNVRNLEDQLGWFLNSEYWEYIYES